MPNKLQELTDRLYNEGLSKGKTEGELLLAKARKEADETVASARKEAEKILSDARKAAEDLKSKAESDIRMASAQCLQATKKDIESLLMHSTLSDKVSGSLSDADFIKEIIRAVADKFSSSEAADLSVILPSSLQKELEPWLKKELSKALKDTIKADFSKKIQGGFTIGPADGGWHVSLTDETFKELISEYLRPVTKKILFG